MPRKPSEVFVEPMVLVWARTSLGRSIEEVANRLDVSQDLVERWESGDKKPTLNQIKKLATFYRRPLAAFFLPVPPKESPLPKDFRTLPGEDVLFLSPETRLAIRRARRLQSLTKELGEDYQGDIITHMGSVSLTDDPEVLATRIRELLGVTIQMQFGWKNKNEALDKWREHIENLGVLVFQMSLPLENARAFSLSDDDIPVIVLNSRDGVRARIFSLLHEFAHLLLNEGGICDPIRGLTWDINSQNIHHHDITSLEVFCNHFAGAILVPKDTLLHHELVRGIRHPQEWDEDILMTLSKKFKVSQEVILRRLLIFNRASKNYYQRKHKEWEAIWKAKVEKEKEAQKHKYLFSINLVYKKHLVDGSIGEVLEDIFKNNRLSLTSEAKITQKDDKNWKIKDDNKIYEIIDTGKVLKIYLQRKGGGLSQPKRCIHENGVPFVSLVLKSYRGDKITYSDVSDFLAVRVKHLTQVERLIEG
jgi:Zn-dependent peptidase ImmA (M78 family)/DNA-binding XRE family transcriptional regulator